MILSEAKKGKVLILGLSGRLDTEGANILVERTTQFLDDGERYILLDFTCVTYVNSAGLRALILMAKQLASAGGMLILAEVSDLTRRVLEITGLAPTLTLRATRAEALDSFPQ